MGPYTITRELAGSVAQLRVSRHFDASNHRQERPLKRPRYIAFIWSNRPGGKFAHKTVRPMLLNDDFAGMQRTRIGAVLEDTARSKKNKRENDRDHHVVMDPATRMCPQDVAFQRLSDRQTCLRNTKLV